MHSTDPRPIVAAIFDAFGTTVHIGRKRHPFRQLLRLGANQGRRPGEGDLHALMTSCLSLEAAAEMFGIHLNAAQLASLQRELDDELSSIMPFPDALEVIQLLKENGIAVGICSNLSQPYGPALRKSLPDVDGFALSYELGVMKPRPEIYRVMCHQLGVPMPLDITNAIGQVVMIGDSVKCDQEGPRAIGISGHYLDRNGSGRFTNLCLFADELVKHLRNGRSLGF